MADINRIKLPNGTAYTLKDEGALQLTGGNVTGPVSFGDSVSIDDVIVGDLVVNGNASFINGKSVANQLIDSLDVANANWTDDTLILTSDATGDTNLYYKRAGIKAWNYIESKISAAGYTKNTGTITSVKTTAGAHTAINTTSGAANFNVPTTAAHVGIKFGYTTSGNNRAVLQDSSGNLYVTQKDNNTTYSAGTGLSLSSTTFSVKLGYTTSGNNRAVQADSSGNLYVVQKDDNTTYSSKAAASGGTAVSLCTTGEKYTWNNKQAALSTTSKAYTNFTVYRYGKVRALYVTKLTSNGSLGTLDSTDRPPIKGRSSGKIYNGSSYVDCAIFVNTNGDVGLTSPSGSAISGAQIAYETVNPIVYIVS